LFKKYALKNIYFNQKKFKFYKNEWIQNENRLPSAQNATRDALVIGAKKNPALVCAGSVSRI